ncbi:hypothetical protein CTAYLR_008633 [Chrysophaeum taylorii]|uniref:Protein YIPF n=1 Tax=Chrysophaeum taylorii TaxID=2483200 RepID=A0AAD7XRD3_9STRA|nr:hypothetical protein CTAYLR_008633 [Chrysophaeum taylorii]
MDEESPSSGDNDVWDDPSVRSAVSDLQSAFAGGGGMQPLEFDSGSESKPRLSGTLPKSGTLDEPVAETILRDLRHIAGKISHVMMPYESQANTLEHLRDWDLWGPLLIGLFLAILLSLADNAQAGLIFSQVFVIIWFGAAVVTLNAVLLGGVISLWQSVCVLGYSVFPLCVARLCSDFVELFLSSSRPHHLLRLFFVIPALLWCTKVSVVFIAEVISPDKKILAVYPCYFFYLWLAWMVLVV